MDRYKTTKSKADHQKQEGQGDCPPPNHSETTADNQGLVPLVTPRPPATLQTTTPPERSMEDSFLITEEEANLLDPTFSLTTPSSTYRDSDKQDSMETEATTKVADKLPHYEKNTKRPQCPTTTKCYRGLETSSSHYEKDTKRPQCQTTTKCF